MTEAEIAARLTKAQRAYMTEKAEWRRPTFLAQKRWMTFPPPNVHAVLIRLGLVLLSGIITTLGLSIRAELMKEKDRGE